MPDKSPAVVCLCPTYRRATLLQNAAACFFEQDYAPSRRVLLVIDDAGQFNNCDYDPWNWNPDLQSWDFAGRLKIDSRSERFPDLPAKYNHAAKIAEHADIFVLWEDDDCYMPWHISAHVAAIQAGARWSKPSKVMSDYPGEIVQEPADGRFFASIAVTRELWNECGGIVDTKRADFDQMSLARFRQIGGPPGDPLDFSPNRVPGYCFRWHSGEYHGQHKMRSPSDTEWYSACADLGDPTPCGTLVPRFDDTTIRIYRQFGIEIANSSL